ncbi:MAG: DNA primase [Phycisphaerae bacterium]|jgi:DNA primase
MAFFDPRQIEDIRNAPQNSIEEVVSEHLKLDRKGKNYIGICPFHDDHKPSMIVTPDIGRFKCFACGAGGDVFGFLQMREGITFPEAVKRLAERAGITLSVKERGGGKESSSAAGELYRINDWALRYWRNVFEKAPAAQKAREYAKNRRLSAESLEKWQIGCALDDWQDLTDAARKAHFSEALLVEAGLSKKNESGRIYNGYRDRLIFPIKDPSGRVIGFGGRTLGNDPAKYINSPSTAVYDKSRCVYGIDNARHSIVREGYSILVEGYTDVIMAHQFGFENVVAALGTSFTTGHARLLRRYAREVVIMLDGDTAGINAAEKALAVCLAENMSVKVCLIESGQDPCELLLSEGAGKFKKLLDNAEEALAWKWIRVKEQFAQANIAERKQIVEGYVKFIAEIFAGASVDSITRGLIVSRAATLAGISRNEVNSLIRAASPSAGSNKVTAKPNRSVMSIASGPRYLAKAQSEVLEVLLCRPELMEKIETRISLSFFSDELRPVASALFDAIHSEDGYDISLFAASLGAPQAVAVNKMIESGLEKDNFEKRLYDALAVLEAEEEHRDEDDSLIGYLDNIKKKQDNKYKNLRKGLL